MRIVRFLTFSILFSAPALAGPNEIEAVAGLEASFYQAFLDRSGNEMATIFADDFVYQHGSGATFDKTAFIKLVESEAIIVTRADTPDLTFRDFGDVIVTYGTGRVDGTVGPDPFATNLRFVNVWHNAGGSWQLVHRNSELLPLE
ncbi:MAG: nuclear transport factor 2 family protein [Pseudomonadota bacterium]